MRKLPHPRTTPSPQHVHGPKQNLTPPKKTKPPHQDEGVVRKLADRMPDVGRKMEYLLNTGGGVFGGGCLGGCLEVGGGRGVFMGGVCWVGVGLCGGWVFGVCLEGLACRVGGFLV